MSGRSSHRRRAIGCAFCRLVTVLVARSLWWRWASCPGLVGISVDLKLSGPKGLGRWRRSEHGRCAGPPVDLGWFRHSC